MKSTPVNQPFLVKYHESTIIEKLLKFGVRVVLSSAFRTLSQSRKTTKKYNLCSKYARFSVSVRVLSGHKAIFSHT